MKELIVVMGISGCGKSTVGALLAKQMEIPFLDADDFHPAENIKKMSRGQALTDDDRWPWLGAIVQFVLDSHRQQLVLGCSALKESYRNYLGQRLRVKLVYLKLTRQEAVARLKARTGHFMPVSLIDSQLETLEPPTDALTISATTAAEEIVKVAIDYFSDSE